MSGDFSRKTFNPKKHYNGVLMQQGRVQLDADWNEQLDIQLYRTRTETKDVIGASGVPKYNDGFRISLSAGERALEISPGRIYTGGLMCELENHPVTHYFNQPYYPNPDTSYFFPSSPLESPLSSPLHQPFPDVRNLLNGIYLIYLDAWVRDINQLDDPQIHEVALGEADTATRTQTVWQVKLLKVAADGSGDVTCNTPFEAWEQTTRRATGRLNARTVQNENKKDPCVLPPGSGYRRLENQLYRIEVQNGGSRGEGTFKWSRDNASVETAIEEVTANTLTVTDIGKDEMLSFAGGQWVEIIDEESALKGKANALVLIDAVKPETREITVKIPLTQYMGKTGLKLRRWDQTGTDTAPQGMAMAAGAATGGWIELEDGVQVTFSDGDYRTGDYWLIPARTASAAIEWPLDASGTVHLEQPPLGIHHHFSCLALLQVQDRNLTLSDCRKRFPTLTEINTRLDEMEIQERLTNTYLIGSGIICGLAFRVTTDPVSTVVVIRQAKTMRIERGFGLTSEGYLLNLPQNVNYDKYSNFNAVKKTYYDRFVDGATGKQKFPLWELKADDLPATKGDIIIDTTPDFFNDKAVLLFVETAELTGKNYHPLTCDDEATTSRTHIRPLLIEKKFLKSLSDGMIRLNHLISQVKMPRFDVQATGLNTAQDVLTAYYSIFTEKFVFDFQSLLSKAYNSYRSFVYDMYNVNPFDKFAERFKFLFEGTESVSYAIQYYYDFFGDLQQTYTELSKAGFSLNTTGCLPENPFPRHLVLGNVFMDAEDKTNNRTYFRPSPVIEKQYEHVQELRSLFRRMVLMIEFIPVISQQIEQGSDAFRDVAITPSSLGDVALSQKAIPFYFYIKDADASLLRYWSHEKTVQGIAEQNLSYHAPNYAKADFVLKPLEFDLEPYNFFRIEGILGKQYQEVRAAIQQQITTFMLPIKVIAVQTGGAFSTEGGLSLKRFLAEHPGMQHKAGVPAGGTFILIYKGSSDESESHVESGTVIADFYLPYICCSEQVDRGVFAIEPDKFLFDDAHNYPFTIQPALSSINDVINNSKLNLLTDENNQLLLHPAMEIDNTMKAALAYNGINLTVTIVRPDAAFTLTISKTADVTGFQTIMIRVAAKNVDANNYKWTYNNNIQNIFQNTPFPQPINYNQLLQFGQESFLIELEVTYEINDQVSTDLHFVRFSPAQVSNIPINTSQSTQSIRE